MKTSYVFSLVILEFKLETFRFQPLVVLFVKTVFDRGAGPVSRRVIIHFDQHSKMLHLVRKVTAVELHFQDGFIKILELWKREHLRHQVETNRLEVNVLTEA